MKKYVDENKVFDLIYSVGSIYITTKEISPAILFGGEWEKIQDKFLLASGSLNTGDTGGEATHQLTENELPLIEGSFQTRPWGSSSQGSNITTPKGVFSAEVASTNALGVPTNNISAAATIFSLSFG
jgi:hypothetical protein